MNLKSFVKHFKHNLSISLNKKTNNKKAEKEERKTGNIYHNRKNKFRKIIMEKRDKKKNKTQ